MRDRISVFHKHEEDRDGNDGRATVLDLQQSPDSNEEQVKEFLKQAQDTRNKIVAIEGLVDQIKRHHSKIHGSASRDEERHKQLNNAMDEIRKLFDTVKLSLKKMETNAKELKDKEAAQNRRPADIRIMSSQYTNLQCWFFESWTEYNECQSDYREKCKEKLTRQIQITEKEVTPEEINDMIESGNFVVFSWNSQFQQKDIEELESRHNDITKLAESLKALHEMFKDLALMVEQQGEMLNNIEKNVENARDYVADAERECHEAVDLTNQFRKKKIICAVIIGIILVILVVVIVIVIQINKSN